VRKNVSTEDRSRPRNYTEIHGSVGQNSLGVRHLLRDVNSGCIELFVCVIPCVSVADSPFLGSCEQVDDAVQADVIDAVHDGSAHRGLGVKSDRDARFSQKGKVVRAVADADNLAAVDT